MIRRVLRRAYRAADRLLPAPDAGPVAAVCHCHHPELVPELVRVLGRLPATAEVHVTSARPDVLDRWRGLDRRRMPAATLHLVENRGRDILPFLAVAATLHLAPDTAVLKVHGKRSDYSGQGDRWRGDLLEGLLPDRRAAWRVARRFRAEARLGALGAPGSYIAHPVYWGRNRETLAALFGQAFGTPPAEGELGFFAGSMFWIRAETLAAVLPLVEAAAFEAEPIPQDGAYAHAIERFLPMAARRLGWRMGEIGRSGTLEPDDVRDRKVPYL